MPNNARLFFLIGDAARCFVLFCNDSLMLQVGWVKRYHNNSMWRWILSPVKEISSFPTVDCPMIFLTLSVLFHNLKLPLVLFFCPFCANPTNQGTSMLLCSSVSLLLPWSAWAKGWAPFLVLLSKRAFTVLQGWSVEVFVWFSRLWDLSAMAESLFGNNPTQVVWNATTLYF